MELLVKIALIVAIVIAVTICVIVILITDDSPTITHIDNEASVTHIDDEASVTFTDDEIIVIFPDNEIIVTFNDDKTIVTFPDTSTIITFNDTITRFTSDVYPIPFDYVINMVNTHEIIDFSQYRSLTNYHHTPEMEYCKLTTGQQAYITSPDGSEISVCLYQDDGPWEMWDMMGSYIPLNDNTPREIQCTNSGGIPINVPDPWVDTLTLCIIDGEDAEPYLFHEWWTRDNNSVQN